MSRAKTENTITVKKSDLTAKSKYDYNKLVYHSERLIDCSITEKGEELECVYVLNGYHPFQEIRKCTKQKRMNILEDAACLAASRDEYTFSMAPDNLYYDDHDRVYILRRDIRSADSEDNFLTEYQALVGYALQKRYTYEDYLEGGEGLYRKHKFLKTMSAAQTVGELADILHNEYEKITEDIRNNKLLVNKGRYRSVKVWAVISLLLLIGCVPVIGYYVLYQEPVQTAKLQAEIDFLHTNYIKVVEDLEPLSMEQLDYEQKYVLSVAYVHLESLTAEQKGNILGSLPMNGEEKLMEYWIHIGRLNPVEAENIAMQRSDDELLLYAYMLDKDLTQTDTVMTGEEKAAKLADLEEKIANLAKQYEAEEE